MLVDEVEVAFIGGHGGAGAVSFGKKKKSGPDGGNGGKGGDIYFSTTSDLTALSQFSGKSKIKAENGQPGASNLMFGKGGKDLEFKVPVGTVLVNKDTNSEIELDDLDKRVLVCKGGRGGKGNNEFKSSTNTTPLYAQSGLPGEEKHLKIYLKLIADFGLIGLPNTGKSSLLNELTFANAKVGDYPFTTLEPNLGMLKGRIIADIPGLVEGASGGKGLGIRFLKHIEKVKLLLHCISTESANPNKDYQVVRDELAGYNPELLKKEEIILITKSDLEIGKQDVQKIKKLKRINKKVYKVSIHDWDSIEYLKTLLIG